MARYLKRGMDASEIKAADAISLSMLTVANRQLSAMTAS